MRRIATFCTTALLCAATALPALADQSRGVAISDQRYQGGKYSAQQRAHVLANCPREYRDIYRGDLYCRKPEFRVLAQRHPACPSDVWGMYRGDLYCFGRR